MNNLLVPDQQPMSKIASTASGTESNDKGVCTAYDLKSFAAHGAKFSCQLCGRAFAAGDAYRWVDAQGKPPVGNFFVCARCDEGDVK